MKYFHQCLIERCLLATIRHHDYSCISFAGKVIALPYGTHYDGVNTAGGLCQPRLDAWRHQAIDTSACHQRAHRHACTSIGLNLPFHTSRCRYAQRSAHNWISLCLVSATLTHSKQTKLYCKYTFIRIAKLICHHHLMLISIFTMI